MTKEEKAAITAQAAEEKAKAKAKAEAEAKKKEEEEADAGSEAETEEEKVEREAKEKEDLLQKEHEAELKKEREGREAAEKVAAKLSFEAREAKRKKDEGDESEDEEDKPLTRKDLTGLLANERQATRKELHSTLIAEKAGKLANSETEAQLIIELHKNRTFPEHLSLDEQLGECFAIANSKKLLAKNEELKRSLRSKETKKQGGEEAQRETLKSGEPKLSPQDAQAIKGSGFEWDGVKKLYKKSLAGSKKILYYDPKTNKRFTE